MTKKFSQKIKEQYIELKELLFSSENRVLTFFWMGCLLGVFLLGNHLQSQTSHFLGIADSRESVINFDFPVTIERIHVMAGQAVEKGDLLVEVDQPDLEAKIRTSKALLEKLQAEQNLKKEMNRLSGFATSDVSDAKMSPLATEIKNLENELHLLESRERSLYIFAETSGVIGSVNFKRGEKASPYSAILTISPSAPTFVEGYIYESIHSKVQMGQQVKVTSTADNSKSVSGRVVAIGSRIVQLPLRMTRVQNHALWGREVAVEIPTQNPFLLGEKVEVYPESAPLFFTNALADNQVSQKPLNVLKNILREISVPESIKNKSSFEPSGLLYLQDLKKFLVVSDDTDEADSPLIFLLNPDGSLDSKTAIVEGLEKMQDIESITEDSEGFIYIMSSQSKSGKDKVKKARNLLVQVKRKGLELRANKVVQFRSALIDGIKKSKNTELTKLLSDIKDDLEIEASLIQNDELFVALKKPLTEDGSSLILNLGSIQKIANSAEVAPEDIQVAYKLYFPGKGQDQTRITDMMAIGSDLLLSTLSKKPGKVGRVWRYHVASSKLTLINEYPSSTPEGLAYNPDKQELMIVFDEGSDNPLFHKLPLNKTAGAE